MSKASKMHGRVYTPQHIVHTVLDHSNYLSTAILKKHVIDNSCGDGAFLCEIVKRYCDTYLALHNNKEQLKQQLETYIHGIELDRVEQQKCISNLNSTVSNYGIASIDWDVLCADTLAVAQYNNMMDYVFGNPPYVRVRNLSDIYNNVKQYTFAQQGMTDLYIVFCEIGFRMMTDKGIMGLITPSSWLLSTAGATLRQHITHHKNVEKIIDLGHYQPFDAATYTIITICNNAIQHKEIEYYTYNTDSMRPCFVEKIKLSDMLISKGFYLAPHRQLVSLKEIKESHVHPYTRVKYGIATLADRIFIGDHAFTQHTIPVIKASTGKQTLCIYPYNKTGKPLPIEEIEKKHELYQYLLSHRDKLPNSNDTAWYTFGRSQAIKDLYKHKYAISPIIKDINSIRLTEAPAGTGVYSGLYILTELDYSSLHDIIFTNDFIEYVSMLKNYRIGGYYSFTAKDLERYLNYKLSTLPHFS